MKLRKAIGAIVIATAVMWLYSITRHAILTQIKSPRLDAECKDRIAVNVDRFLVGQDYKRICHNERWTWPNFYIVKQEGIDKLIHWAKTTKLTPTIRSAYLTEIESQRYFGEEIGCGPVKDQMERKQTCQLVVPSPDDKPTTSQNSPKVVTSLKVGP